MLVFTLKQAEEGEGGGGIAWRYLANTAAMRRFFFNLLLSFPPSRWAEDTPRLGCCPSQSWLFFLPQRQNLWVLILRILKCVCLHKPPIDI